MEEKTTEITLAVEGTVTITTAEYRELIACQTMLDMILTSARKDTSGVGYPDQIVVRMADSQRMLYLPAIQISKKSGDEDA